MTNLYFRVALKRSEEIKQKDRKQETINGIKSEELEGLASTLKQKLGLMDGPTHQTNQKNQRELQSTLIQANKLPPSKPRL